MIDVKKKLGGSLRFIASITVLLAVACILSQLVQTATGIGPALTGSEYRMFETSSSTIPGAPLAVTSAAGQLSIPGQSFRMRTGVTTRPDSTDLTLLQAGWAASCALVSGSLHCSGRNTNGELGNGNTLSTNNFTPVDTSTGLAGKTVTSLAINQVTTSTVTNCAIADGVMYCWGSNSNGVLAVNQTSSILSRSLTPLPAVMDGSLAGESIKSISAGESHSCGVTVSGKGFCWGYNVDGRLGDGTTTNRLKPTELNMTTALAGKTITDIAAGSSQGCAIAQGLAYCWGGNTSRSLGNNSTAPSLTAVPVFATGPLLGRTLVSIRTSLNTTCALDSLGKVFCWGMNGYMYGNGTNTTAVAPRETDMSLVAGGAFSSISSSSTHFCGIGASDGIPYCWGANSNGATGIGQVTGSSVRPTPMTTTGYLSGKTVTSLTTGSQITCGITNLKEGFCTGTNVNGNFGYGGNMNPFYFPTAISTANFPTQGVTIASNTLGARLEFAPRTAGSCSTQTTGFQAVTTSSAIAWSTNPSVISGTAISADGNDPVSGSTTTLQTYVSATATFNNPNAIIPGNTGLWDFSLKDNSGLSNQTYCMRIAQSNGTPYDAYTAYPEVTTAQGGLSVGIVDASGVDVLSPSVSMPGLTVTSTCQTSTGTLGTSSQRIRVTNDTSAPGWSLSIAATNGATAVWQNAGFSQTFDYNDSSGSPSGCLSGLDGDGIAGQLTVNPSVGGSTITPKSGCTTTGISKGTQQGFVQGSVDTVTLITASSGANTSCYWDITGFGLSQTIPAAQPTGGYVIDTTLTVLAQ